MVLDAPASLREAIDPWAAPSSGAAFELTRTIKARFDPDGICNPGIFVGGL